MPRRIILVRHGHTKHNSHDPKTNRFMSWDDHVELSAQGRLDAIATAKKLGRYQIDTSYHSDLLRTQQTAAIISSHLKITSIPNHLLRERNLGNFTGLTPHHIMTKRPEDWRKFNDHHDTTWNGLEGESLQHVHERIQQLHTNLEQRHTDSTVLLITHSGIIHITLRDHFHLFPTESFIEVGHSAITVIDKVDGKYQLTLHNEG